MMRSMKILQLLDQLDEHLIKATTFFASYEQLEMNPEAVDEILGRGYKIENNGLYGMDLDVLAYDDIYQRIDMTNEKIEEMSGESGNYVYSRQDDNGDVNAIIAQLDMPGVIKPVAELKAIDDEEKLIRNMKNAISRGGVLSMNPKDADLIPYPFTPGYDDRHSRRVAGRCVSCPSDNH